MYYVNALMGLTGIIFVIFLAIDMVNKAGNKIDNLISKAGK
jgi:hypothetical protein